MSICLRVSLTIVLCLVQNHLGNGQFILGTLLGNDLYQNEQLQTNYIFPTEEPQLKRYSLLQINPVATQVTFSIVQIPPITSNVYLLRQDNSFQKYNDVYQAGNINQPILKISDSSVELGNIKSFQDSLENNVFLPPSVKVDVPIAEERFITSSDVTKPLVEQTLNLNPFDSANDLNVLFILGPPRKNKILTPEVAKQSQFTVSKHLPGKYEKVNKADHNLNDVNRSGQVHDVLTNDSNVKTTSNMHTAIQTAASTTGSSALAEKIKLYKAHKKLQKQKAQPENVSEIGVLHIPVAMPDFPDLDSETVTSPPVSAKSKSRTKVVYRYWPDLDVVDDFTPGPTKPPGTGVLGDKSIENSVNTDIDSFLKLLGNLK